MIDLELDKYSSISKSQTIFYSEIYHLFHKAVYDIVITFESYDEKQSYLDKLCTELAGNNFAYYDVPIKIKVPRKTDAYYNKEKGLILAYSDDNSNALNFNLIHVSEDFEPLN